MGDKMYKHLGGGHRGLDVTLHVDETNALVESVARAHPGERLHNRTIAEGKRRLAEDAGDALTEDTGDVTLYLNVTDFFKADGGTMSHEQGKVAEQMLQSVVDGALMRTLHKEVKSALRSNSSWTKQAAAAGLALK